MLSLDSFNLEKIFCTRTCNPLFNRPGCFYSVNVGYSFGVLIHATMINQVNSSYSYVYHFPAKH